MIKPIMKDVLFLSRPSVETTREDASVIRDLTDTLLAHREGCVGMAANMIGVSKRIICVMMGPMPVAMINPVIVDAAGVYEAEEGCLSLTGVRKCRRFRDITVTYQDASFLPRRQKYSGWIAQIIQHEVDHLNGVII